MTCPNCGSSAIYINDTMHGPDGKVYRRRHCIDCKTKFRTVEIIAEDTDEFREAYAAAVGAKSALFKKEYDKRKGNKK